MEKILSKKKKDKYDSLLKRSSIHREVKNLSKEEKIEIKSHAMKKAVKLKKYVRN